MSHVRLSLSLLLLAFAILACGRSGLEEVQQADTPTSLPTLTNPPSQAPTRLPQPTATYLPDPTPTTKVTATPCALSYFFQPAPPMCPGDDAVASLAAEQPFEGGVMIWLEAMDSIYVFFNDQSWQRFDDLWDENQITSDPSIIPPADRFQPIRGFGKVWRENNNVRDNLGWALGLELGFDSFTQESVEIDGAPVLFVRTYNGQVFALTRRGPDEGDWVVAAS